VQTLPEKLCRTIIWVLYVPLLLHVLFPNSAAAQDLETIADEKPISLNGAISATLTSYNASGMEDRHTPFTWLIEGSPTLALFGIQIPFTFIVSEQQREFRQPFNQFGLTPTYKRFTGHLGYASMNFSRYTLAGHTFLGAGFDFKPGIFRLSALYGRFQIAIEENIPLDEPSDEPSTLPYVDPAYERFGYGAKIGIGGDRDFFDLNMFYAGDDSSSLTRVPTESDVLPAENLVIGMNSRIDILQEGSTTLSIEAEGASSVFTRDVRAATMTSTSIPRGIHDIFRITEATSFTFATQAALAFRMQSFQAKINWERVEPDYRSLGTYYLLTDIERWTFAPTLMMLDNKLRLNTSIGLEHDNLLNERVRTTNRFIGSAAISYNPSQAFGIDLNYSNFTTDQKRAITIADLRDTLPDGSLRLTHNISQSITVAPRLLFQEESLNQMIAFVGAYQEYQDRTPGLSNLSDSKALTASINYNRAYLQLGRTIGASLIFSRAEAGLAQTRMIGGSINGSINLLTPEPKEGEDASTASSPLTISGTFGVTTSKVSTLNTSTFSLNETLNASYKATENNVFTFSVYASQNSGYETDFGEVEGYGELTATLSYSHLLDF
jgi:hypothetical protein